MNRRSPKDEETNGLGNYEAFAKLHNYKVPLEVNIRRYFQTTFQELLVIAVLSIITTIVDYGYFTLLRKEGEDDTVPIGFPFALIFGVVAIKYLIETIALKEFCTYFGLNYMGSSSLRRISIKIFVMAFLALIKCVAPILEVPDRQKEREEYVAGGGTWMNWGNIKNLWLLAQGMVLAHVGMHVIIRTYIDFWVYAYKLWTYQEKDEMQVLEQKKQETRRSPRELNNNSHLNFRGLDYGMLNQTRDFQYQAK